MRPCSLLASFAPGRRVSINRKSLTRSFNTARALRSPTHFYDVVCIGGGPAGLSLVTGLRSSEATANLKIALIESQDLSKTVEQQRDAIPSSFSNRCSSVTPETARFFQSIGAWAHIDETRIQPYEEMKVWDGVSGARINFDWDSTGRPPPDTRERTIAYMVENSNITSALLRRAQELRGISFYEKTVAQDIKLGEDDGELDLTSWPILTLSDGSKLAARLLVGADGANSPVRMFSGISSHGWDYNRHGVVATVTLGNIPGRHHATAYQRFLPTGPVALLPLPGGLASLVWSTLPSCAAALKQLSSEDMAAMINAAFRLSPVDLEYLHTIASGHAEEIAWRVKHTPFDDSLVPPLISRVQASSVASFPLRMRHAATYIGERVALVGDAAHTVHPLAGQGLNLGVADSMSLQRTLEDAVTAGADIGGTLSLEPYSADRYAKNHIMLGICDKLHKLYSVGSGPVVALRSFGLSAVDAMGWFKGTLMRSAAGS